MQIAKNLNQLGTESAFEVLARAAELDTAGHDVINLGIGQPDFKTPNHIVEAGIKALRDGHHGYTPANGILPLREAVAADFQRRHGADVHPDCVVVQPGGKPTMFFCILMFGEPGVEILYPDPGFPIYKSMIEYSGASAIPILLKEENEFSFSADEVLDQITSKTRLIILNSPANPCGGAVPKSQFDKLIGGLQKWPEVAIFSDEIYSQMLYGEREHVTLLNYPEIRDRLIVLDGWSKTYAMTGWRLGCAVWPRELAPIATRLAINCHSCVNAVAQHAGIAALEGPQNAVRNMVAAFDARRRIIVESLNSIDGFHCIEPGGAFYAFPNISGTGMDAKTLQDLLLEKAHVATVAGTAFGDNGEGFLRFSYANSKENIIEAIDRIRNCLTQ
ncbi:MAG: pyridoxal phosphate-dependent aminotransferase [Pseudomonadota bacterium]|nr:pyridoxal phosphate-dependent aminotransferase [Pseudomonadota bacterium]